jgi:hypothetical protein
MSEETNSVIGGEAEVATEVAAPAAETNGISWTSALPAELQSDPAILKFTDVGSLAAGYKNLEKSVGSNKISIPDEHATEADWAELFKKLGNPETLEDYGITDPEKGLLDDEFLNGFKEQAHRLGILPRQAQEMINWYSEQTKELNSTTETNVSAEMQETEGALKKEWGVGYSEKLTQIESALKRAGGDEFVRAIQESGLGRNVTAIKAFALMADKLGEDRGVNGATGKPVTTQDHIEKARQMMGDPNHPYNVKTHPNHKAARKEFTDLYELAYPEE